MRIHKRKAVGTALAALIVLACLIAGFGVHAVRSYRDEGGAEILSGIDPDFLAGQIDGEVDFFNTPQVFWTADGESVTLRAANSLPDATDRVFEGSRSLLITGETSEEEPHLTIRRRYPDGELPDFSRSRYFTFSLCLPQAQECTVSLVLRSSLIVTGETERSLNYENTAVLSEKGWHTLVFDISAFLGRTSIREIEITVGYEPTSEPKTFSCAMDAVGFSSAGSLVHVLKYLSDSYAVADCTLSYAEHLKVSATESTAEFSVSDMSGLVVNDETALCVTLINYASFRTLCLEVTDAQTGEIERVMRTLESNNETQYVYFPIQTKRIARLAFRLEGPSRGEMTILSIAPVSYMVSQSEPLGTLQTCVLDQTRKGLEITGTLHQGTAAQSELDRLCLYELSLNQTLKDLMDGNCKRIDSQSVKEQFSFEITVPSAKTALTSRWAVALERNGQLHPISEPICLQNPEIFAGESETLPDTDSKKGYAPLYDTDVFDGIAYTAIPVRLEELLTLDRTEFSYEIDGDRYYYRESTVREIDALVAICKDRGIRATLVLTVSPSQDAALNRILLHPQAEETAAYCAFNTQTDEGISYLRAATEMLARRYNISFGDRGGVAGFAVGQHVNDTRACYNMGDTTLKRLVTEYASALRLVYNTVTAVNPSFAVYASVDCRWNIQQPRGNASAFGARPMLDLLNYVISSHGNFGWRVAYDPYPDGEYYAFEDKTPETTPEASRVTLANLEVMTAYVTRTAFYYDRQYRPILLLEQITRTDTSAEEDEAMRIKQSVDYVCGYYKISTRNFPFVTALVVNHDVTYNDTLCYIDTEHSAAATVYALEVLGIKDWSAVLTAFDPSAVVVRSLTKSMLTHQTPSSVVGEMVLWDFEKRGSTGGWKAGNGVLALTPGTGVGGAFYLSVQTEDTEKHGSFREITLKPTSAYDFTLTPYLRFSCNVSGLVQDVETLELTVAAYSGENCLRAEAQITPGTVRTIVMDMKDFDGISKVDCIRILLRGRDGESIGTPTLLIGQIDGLSDRYVDAELKDKFEQAQSPGVLAPNEQGGRDTRQIVILGAVAAVALMLEVFHIVHRKKKVEN